MAEPGNPLEILNKLGSGAMKKVNKQCLIDTPAQ